MFLSAVLSLGLALPVWAATVKYPDVTVNGSITAESKSGAGTLDGPKVTPGVNDTSYDWWYFDAVSASTSESVTVVFYNSGSKGFINDFLGGPLSVSVSGTFANGSIFSLSSPATDGAVITTEHGGIHGDWKGSGIAFRGTNLESHHPTYSIIIDAPEIGIHGIVNLKSTAPPHYPCGPDVSGEEEQMLPHVYWSNAIPDAFATVDLNIDGAHLRFGDGIGYHDKNWGDISFLTATTSWYWGHARVGPYSIVWFDAIDSTGAENFSGYVTKHGEVLESSCAKDAVVVRPWGANSEYPPTSTTGVMQGLNVVFDLGHETKLVANVTTGQIAVENAIYVRAEGTVIATLEGREGCDDVFKGRALFEEFKI